MKILYVTTISNTVNAFLIPHIKMLIENGHNVDVAFNTEQKVNEQIFQLGCKVHQVEFQRSPFKKDNYSACKKLSNIIREEGYDVVHTHTPIASFCVRFVCREIENIVVIYTAHGLHFFKGAPILNWLLYYPAEKLMSKHTDILLTINKEDYERAKKKLKMKKVEYMPGVGFDTKRFSDITVNKMDKRSSLGVPLSAVLLLSVGELNKNKNHEVIIKAIAKLNNPNVHYVICGEGPLKKHLSDLVVKLGIDNQIKLLGFRNDIAEICKISDVFIFPSKREGLGMAALEAMASGLPLLTSNIHGINDYSINGKTGFSCSPNDIDGFVKKISILVSETELREQMGINNIQDVKKYDITNSNIVLENIYSTIHI